MIRSKLLSSPRNFILSLFILFSLPLFSSDWELIDPEFAEAYEIAQEILDEAIREAQDQGRTIRTGAMRARQHSHKWREVSLGRKLHIYYGNQPLDYVPQNRGKVYIEKTYMTPGDEYVRVVFDASGDYYRVERGVYTGRTINSPNSEFHRYLDVYGDYLDKPHGMSSHEWRNYFRENTHFRARP